MFKKKQAKKTIFAPKIALRVECSDPARNPYFPADFLSVCLQCSQLLWNCAKIKVVYRRARGERRLEIAQSSGLNCSMTHSPGKIEYNCRYFFMTFRTQIHKKNSVKMVFILTGYYVSPPIDQYLKFKNHCSLMLKLNNDWDHLLQILTAYFTNLN
jgi:hypothetical protein